MWTSKPVSTGAESLAPTVIRSPDHPARLQMKVTPLNSDTPYSSSDENGPEQDLISWMNITELQFSGEVPLHSRTAQRHLTHTRI